MPPADPLQSGHPPARQPAHDARAHDAARRELWVVCAVSNPMRYKSRFALYREFRRHVLRDLGLNLCTVECAHGERDHYVAAPPCDPDAGGDPDAPRTLDLRVWNSTALWLKEALWNLGARALPREARYVMFCDADIAFLDRHVGTEVVHALQVERVVQPFETCAMLGPTGAIQRVDRSFGYCHAQGWEWKPQPEGGGGAGGGGGPARYYASKPPPGVAGTPGAFGSPWHPGFCMAMKRETFEALGGLLEVGVCGAGDHHMMGAMLGKAHLTIPEGVHPNYKKAVMAWQERARTAVAGHLGYVHGTIAHGFHAPLRKRYYTQRWKILIDHAFDPEVHVSRNACGVPDLDVAARPALHRALIRYFRDRDEDSVE